MDGNFMTFLMAKQVMKDTVTTQEANRTATIITALSGSPFQPIVLAQEKKKDVKKINDLNEKLRDVEEANSRFREVISNLVMADLLPEDVISSLEKENLLPEDVISSLKKENLLPKGSPEGNNNPPE